MKKLVIYTLKDIDKIDFFREYGNRLLRYENGNYYFYSNYSGKEKIEFQYEKINIKKAGESFDMFLYKIYEIAMKEAKKLSNEPIGHVIKGKSYKSVISSVIMKISHADKESDIFSFLAEIFTNLLMGHILTNGNKRSATMFLKLSLKYFGYYLKWTEGLYKDYKMHEEKIGKFVAKMESNNAKKIRTETKQEILDWIKYNVIIDLRFKYE